MEIIATIASFMTIIVSSIVIYNHFRDNHKHTKK